MVGTTGERMLRITLPHVMAWNAWYRQTRNTPEGVRPLRELVDRVASDVGRAPHAVERTVAVLVQATGGRGRQTGGDVTPLSGPPDAIAEGLRAYAKEGIGHVQLVIDPITVESIEEVARALPLLDRAANA
jgi:alkanesulfonate monooxygenase SsuD/methylene tetrahydromethanopterin reductase-like flavin-dependent oxidoreductase (luciferase family)